MLSEKTTPNIRQTNGIANETVVKSKFEQKKKTGYLFIATQNNSQGRNCLLLRAKSFQDVGDHNVCLEINIQYLVGKQEKNKRKTYTKRERVMGHGYDFLPDLFDL